MVRNVIMFLHSSLQSRFVLFMFNRCVVCLQVYIEPFLFAVYGGLICQVILELLRLWQGNMLLCYSIIGVGVGCTFLYIGEYLRPALYIKELIF